MALSEKDPRPEPQDSDPKDQIASDDVRTPPKLDAILPDDLPPAAAELVGDIDSYQKRMEKEWETAKNSYEQKINRIMEEFMVAGHGSNPTAPPPEEPIKKSRFNNDRLKSLMGELEQELRRASKAKSSIPFRAGQPAGAFQLGWQGSQKAQWKKWGGLALGLAGIGLATGYFLTSFFIKTFSLPYHYTLGPIFVKDNVVIMDWFRRSLYVHKLSSDLPIQSVESLSNSLATGLAWSEKTLWSLDSLDRKINLHTTTPEHQIVASVDSPGTKPVGLFFDGTDLWSADQDTKKLYRHRGNDLEEIRDTFPLPDANVTAFSFYKNRLWILDGKSRLINVYRLQKPLLSLRSFDLDPFLKGSLPTGFSIQKGKMWVVTENPSSLIRIPLSRLKKSKTEEF
ncbi:MAG: hypothetical protein KCHDKBKB_01221 [Elusimicrobia bacterium]|nr:hypothetical protein [Elusimicrobiota bacterium]